MNATTAPASRNPAKAITRTRRFTIGFYRGYALIRFNRHMVAFPALSEEDS